MKPEKDSKVYVLGMAVGIHQYHQSQLKSLPPNERKEFLTSMRYRLLRMKVDVGFTPPDDEVPQLVFVSRVMLDEDLTENDVMNVMYKVRNAGTLVILCSLTDLVYLNLRASTCKVRKENEATPKEINAGSPSPAK